MKGEGNRQEPHELQRSRSRSRSPRSSHFKPLSEENVTYIFLSGIQPTINEADIINSIAQHIRVFVIITHHIMFKSLYRRS